MTPEEEKERAHTSVRAVSAFFKLLGWVALGIGFGFALTLFTFASSYEVETDKIISLAGGLICLLVTLLIFVVTYGMSEILKMFLSVDETADDLAERLGRVVDQIEIMPEEPVEGPKVEEIESPEADGEPTSGT
jgi:hypothetical protein